jgi:hypothetical protein
MSLKKLVESTNQQLDELNLPPKIIPMDPKKLPDHGVSYEYDDPEYPGDEGGMYPTNMDSVTQRQMSSAKGGEFKGDKLNPEEIKNLLYWVSFLKKKGTHIPNEIQKMLTDNGL